MTSSPTTTKGTITNSHSIEGGTIPAPSVGELGGVRGGAAGALPAAVGGEDVAERGQLVVVRDALLVVDHQKTLRPGPDLLGHVADRLAHLVLRGRRPAAGPLGLVREDAGGAAARARLGRGGGPRPPRADEQPAVRALLGLLRPVGAHPLLDEEVTVRAVRVPRRPPLLTCRRCHPAPGLRLFAETRATETRKWTRDPKM